MEAIQWNGDNQKEVSKFIGTAANGYCTKDDGYGNLNVCYMDRKKRKHLSVVPKFGWVVIEGKTLQFYKDETFRKTFKAAEEDSKGIDWAGMDKIVSDAFDSFDDIFKGFHGVSKEKIQKAVDKKESESENKEEKDIDSCDDSYLSQMEKLANGRTGEAAEDFIKRVMQLCHISRGEAVDKLADDLTKSLFGDNVSDNIMRDKMLADKERSAKHVESDTFESVLNEMKELHVKKNADYGDAAHTNFLRYGPVASLSRLSEKMQRAEHIFLSGKCEVKDEPLTSTLIAMAITSAMLYMELKNKKNEED